MTSPTFAVALLILTCFAGQARGAPADDLISAVMKGRYVAGYVSARHCWLYVDKEYGRYCVKPLKSEWVESGDRRRLYLLTSGVPINADGTIDDLPAHVLPGLVGAFALVKGLDGKPRYLAATDALMFGSFGASGARSARLTAIGPSDYYAWVFSSGGTWQGISVGSYNILAPRGDKFVDVSTIPVMREDDQAHSYDIAFDSSKSDRRVFPLIVTKQREVRGKRLKPVVDRFVVPFNLRTWRYEMPRNH
ncbi:MAG: hypothetical protein WBX11_00190 [Thiobacillaceae bacterium]